MTLKNPASQDGKLLVPHHHTKILVGLLLPNDQTLMVNHGLTP